jgi:very-short-patch-repair endonuclease
MGELNLKHTPNVIASSLRNREWWKYEDLDEYLTAHGIEHEFEFVVGDKIFDLGLPQRKILIEFDGRNHSCARVAEQDTKKDVDAESKGFKVIRVPVKEREKIHPRVLYALL